MEKLGVESDTQYDAVVALLGRRVWEIARYSIWEDAPRREMDTVAQLGAMPMASGSAHRPSSRNRGCAL